MSDETKELIRIIVLDLLVAVVLIVCYSPGFLDLRPSDYSILRAGLSIVIVPIALILLYFINLSLVEQKSVKTHDGKRIRVKATDGDILAEINELVDKIKDRQIAEKSNLCRSCVADIFLQANDDENDLTVPVVRQKIQYYLDVYIETLKRMITMEKYSNTSLYRQSYAEISSTMDLLQEVFLKALDQMLSNTLSGAELDKIVLKQMMAMDGFGHNPFEELKNKYS